ncbi:RING-type E3 ubiquitin-protein ligase PPIL2-like isoform X2 [Myxocyprinus asiaticus]|uniref:RING-type E3 ubiquitin-protein ligase PPIL2-like isoform X2 n=1 Tax=Myxocyprinus asiaticus TaxID=70543 RepID=UPI0022236996|nr:RING-type E3 ubiquitin-protein ligase PPIL2-like isoform X2 [Myxocyprinus asiaticus]
MGKRHKDKMCRIHSVLWREEISLLLEIPQANFRRLRFDHCSLSLQPFEYPMCTVDGVVFDLMRIVPWIKKFGTNPITGEKLKAKSLIKLNFSKNNEVDQLNIKIKNYKDLLTDEPFTRQDIITLQDPTNLDKFNISNFFHVKNSLKVLDPDEEKAKQDPAYHLKSTNLEMCETLAELYRDYKEDELLASTMKDPETKKTDGLNAAHYSTGRVSASFTSTAMAPATAHEADVRRKATFVCTQTNENLNLELHCDKSHVTKQHGIDHSGVCLWEKWQQKYICFRLQMMFGALRMFGRHGTMVPKTGENFIKLCKKGYYDGTVFHRSIRNFMIQGGDPTVTGTGGESFLGKPFKDEFRPNLSHTGCGVLSMANSGPNTNKSQFFITFCSCAYLDRKHTVFGRVVGGFETLTAMENIESDPKTDKPKSEIKVLSATVFVDPYEEADALESIYCGRV